MRNRVRQAFTLVEILIVVVILGILAAIVVPQFTNATQEAQGGNIQTQIDTIQNQLELYKARNGVYPDIATDWSQLLPPNGYLKTAPINPVNNSTTVTPTATGVAGFGWHWDAATGTLGACYFDEATGKVTPGVP